MSARAARLGLSALGVAALVALTTGVSAAQNAAPAAASAAAASAAAADPAQLAKGKQVFVDYGCASCHALADAGADGHVGPSLDGNPNLNETYVAQRVANGGGPMPAFGDQLTKEEIAALAAYIAHAKK